MTTFTKISEAEKPSIIVSPTARISRINDNIYGGFTEHMGRCIYGGIYDPGNSLSDENGFRMDVIAALKELRVPVVRYPGGNFCATYHWLDGVGPKDQRPSRPELAWLGTETNQFGTDEFMQWCKAVGTEPYLCLNMGTGTLDEALAWVEYCNGTGNTYYANLRRKNGHEEPYNVKYWALGNETWGPWQVAQLTATEYAERAHQWAKALKLLCPSIQLILCGETGHSSWDHVVLQRNLKYEKHNLGGLADPSRSTLIDMHSIHIYTAAADPVANALAPRVAERSIQMAAALIDLARVEGNVPVTVPRPTICFDEWNVWDPVRAPGEAGAEEKYALSDALAVAVWLNVFIRQSRYVGMANIAQSVNVISPLMTTREGILKQTTWWPLLLWSKYMRGETLAVHVAAPEYEGELTPAWIRGALETPWLDVAAAVDGDGWVSLGVVNVHPEKDFEIEIGGVKQGEVDVYTVSGPSMEAVNVEGKEEVGVKESIWDGKGSFTFPKHSITLLRWKA